MRRLAGILAVLAATAAFAVLGMGAGSQGGEPYFVRAIFDNAGFVIAGEDVKVAGVKVGTVESLDVTPEDKAAIVLRIEDPGFQDFRSDATCQIRPQSLIGERFVECSLTRKRAVGTPAPPPLKRIERGADKGQRLLPVAQTRGSVDLDLINNVMRLPYRQRFSIILNELGTGLAGRGSDLREVIRRADPALREIDEVLAVLADQNETLTRLAEESDEALAPLARDRERVTGFIERSTEVAQATAERREDLEADIERLPRFLAELTPTMARLQELSNQAAPVFADLGARAPQVNQVISELGPFSQAGTRALQTLGDAAQVGMPALEDARPVVGDLRALARTTRPVGTQLSAVLESFQQNRGIERLMDFFFYGAGSINGFDEFGHYLRAALLVNTCSGYTTAPIPGCLAKFRPPENEEAEVAAAASAKATATATPAPGPTPAPREARPDPAESAVLDYLFEGSGR